MSKAVSYLILLFLVWYLALTFGCISAYQADIAPDDPPSNEQVQETAMAVQCLAPEPTLKGIILAIAGTAAATYGLRE